MLARYDADNRFIAPTPLWRLGVGFLTLIALAAAGALLSTQLALRFSDSGFDLIEHLRLRPVAESPWSTWLGIPVGLLATPIYGAMLVALLFVGPGSRSRRQGLAWRVLVVLALTVLGAAIWFAVVQFLDPFCPVCVLGQLAGATAALAILLRSPMRLHRRRRPHYDPVKLRRHHVAWLSGAALVLVSILAVGQIFTGWLESDRDNARLAVQPPTLKRPSTQPASDDIPDLMEPSHEKLATAGKLWHADNANTVAALAEGPQLPAFRFRGSIYLDRREYPMVGRIDAPALALWLLDYHDPSSRIMFRQMEEVRRRFGSQLAIMIIPVDAPADAMHSLDYVPPAQPIDPKDDLTALALMVFKAKPESFELFHRYLLSGDKAPALEAARQFAGSLVGPERLRLLRNDLEVQDQMQRHIRIFKTSEVTTVPQLRAPGVGATVTPQHPQALNEIMDFMQTKLNLKPIDASTHVSAPSAAATLQ